MNSQNENEARAVERAEPVAWRLRIGSSDMWSYTDSKEDADFYGKESGLSYVKEPLYLASEVARLTGEVSRLQKSLDQLTGMKFSDRIHAALVSRAEAAERRVAELIESARSFLTASDAYDSAETSSQYPDNQGLLRAYRWARKELEEVLTQPEADHG